MLKIHFKELRDRAPQKMVFHTGCPDLDKTFRNKRKYYAYLAKMEQKTLYHLQELFAINSEIVKCRAQMALFMSGYDLHRVQKSLRAFEHFMGNAISQKETYYAPSLFWGFFKGQSSEFIAVVRIIRVEARKKGFTPIVWDCMSLERRLIQFQMDITIHKAKTGQRLKSRLTKVS